MVYIAKWKVILILAVCALGLIYASPNLLDQQDAESLPGWGPNKQVSLGLDLQGGSHLLLEVKYQEVMRERLESLVDSVRSTLRSEQIRYNNLGVSGDGVGVTIRDADQVSRAAEALEDLDADTELSIQDDIHITLELTELAIKARRLAVVDQSIEIVRNRVDETGVREPTIQRQGEDRILVQLPGIEDPERIKQLLGRTAKMTFHMVDTKVPFLDVQAGRMPPGSMAVPHASEIGPDGQPVKVAVEKRIRVGGDSLVDAQSSFDSRTNEPVVSFRFDSIGARKFSDVTRDNVGKPFAIVLDGKVVTAPVIREPILGGNGQISGNFSVLETHDLALLLRAGALPAPLVILEERTVGPGLGADSIAAGQIACIVGMIAVVIFMVVSYGRFGAMADLALMFNVVLIIAALSLVQATLTLPGIAGIVLTIGMAVDANVLIFERIREELRAGRTPISAVDAGYSRAMLTIIDANVTTLIAAILLYAFGSGPVRGFAVTLGFGIASSMFTAIMVTRLMVVGWLRHKRPQTLTI